MDANNVGPAIGKLQKESFRPLEEEDRQRIKKVLDYWFSEHYGTGASQSSLMNDGEVEIKKQ